MFRSPPAHCSRFPTGSAACPSTTRPRCVAHRATATVQLPVAATDSAVTVRAEAQVAEGRVSAVTEFLALCSD